MRSFVNETADIIPSIKISERDQQKLRGQIKARFMMTIFALVISLKASNSESIHTLCVYIQRGSQYGQGIYIC